MLGLIPVYCGQGRPIIETVSIKKDYWYGQDGLDDHPETYPPSDSISNDMIEPENGVLAIIRLVNSYEGEVDLIATGPLTNIALALSIDPSLPQKLKSFTIMGGNMYSFGNAPTYLAEYNLYSDPEAAYIALERIVPQVNRY